MPASSCPPTSAWTATYNLSSLSVYLQVIPYLLFGKSVFVTRAVSVLAATFGAVMVGLTLRDIFKIRYWWSSVLLLSVIPAWFLHSRTAFETVEMTAFYAAFLYFYLRYRTINPRALYAALIFGATGVLYLQPGAVDHCRQRRLSADLRPALPLAAAPRGAARLAAAGAAGTALPALLPCPSPRRRCST